MIAEGKIIVTVAEPDFVVSCVDVAVIVAVPAADGVNTPEEEIEPPVAVQVTAEPKFPVPVTVAEHVLVWAVVMEDGEHETLTDVIETGTVTVTVAKPDLVVSCVEVAVMVAVPALTPVTTPVFASTVATAVLSLLHTLTGK